MPASLMIRLDALDRGKAGVPDRLGVIAAEVLDELGEIEIGHTGDVRGRGHRIHAPGAPPLDHCDRPARLLQQVGSRQARDAGADHDDVDGQILIECWIAGNRLGVGPV
jgi:hypothetical protein